MVTRSTDNYDLWKEEVRLHYLKLYPNKEKGINLFMQHISKTYDPIGRAFFPYKIMWYLYDRMQGVRNHNQHFWIAFIGKKGGEGKSTLAKQILHFLDNSFHSDTRVAMEYDKFLKDVYIAKVEQKIEYPGLLMDEIDIKIHASSKEGRAYRSILTKIRQENLLVGVCANSLNDIPPFVLDRMNCICYLNEEHRFWLWDTLKDRPKYSVISDIRKLWKEHRHGVFTRREILKRAYLKNLHFSDAIPFKETEYNSIKNKDLYKEIKKAIDLKDGSSDTSTPSNPPPPPKMTNQELIAMISKNNPDLTDGMIGKTLNLSRQWVNTLRNRGVKCQEGKEYNNIMPGE